MESWFRYCMSRGEDHLLKNLPINKKTGKILDMYRLYAAMTRRGGSSKVVKDKKMKFVTSYMGFEHTSEIASALKIIYRKYLYAFEQKAMFQRDIPIVRVFFFFFFVCGILKHDILSSGKKRNETENNFF